MEIRPLNMETEEPPAPVENAEPAKAEKTSAPFDVRRKIHSRTFIQEGEEVVIEAVAIPSSTLYAKGMTPPMFAAIHDPKPSSTPPPENETDEEKRARVESEAQEIVGRLGPGDIATLLDAAVTYGLYCPVVAKPGAPRPVKCGRGHEGHVVELDDLGAIQGQVGWWVLAISGYGSEVAGALRFRR